MTEAPISLPLLQDGFGRTHSNLRVSVTDRCNLRCFYCMPAENVSYLPRPEILTFEEITRFVRCMVQQCGVNKIRVTGGEPLVRQNIETLIEQLLEISGLHDLALTTNAILLGDQAEKLYCSGLRRINISLDSLDEERFKLITRRTELERVLEGIQAAKEIGFGPIKLNAVAIRGISEPDLVPLAEFGRESGLEVRFIEYMPLDAEKSWEREKVLQAGQILETLSREICPLVPDKKPRGSQPAARYNFMDGKGSVGIIASVSQPFCENCNRFRLTADGKIRNCLFSLDEVDVRELLRSDASDQQLIETVQRCISVKKIGHEINTSQFFQPARPMYSIGG